MKQKMAKKNFNILLTGVGGTGVLMAASVLARAANLDGHKVAGIQLHGRTQRGGSIPTHVRFGKEIHSPTIPRAQADLILGLELIEPARACYYADKARTNFLVDTYTVKPVYAHLHKQRYPSIDDVKKMVRPFAKDTLFVNAGDVCEKELGDPVYSNSTLLGIAVSTGFLPLSEKSVAKALEQTIPRDVKENHNAFKLGLKFKRQRY